MPRGRRDRFLMMPGTGWLALPGLMAALSGCNTSQPAQACTFAEVYEYSYPASSTSVALSSTASLVRLTDSGQDTFMLMGADNDGGTVRWAILPRDPSKNQVVDEASAPVPAHEAGPWFGLAQDSSAGDRVVIAWGEASGQGFDVRAYGVPTAGGATAAPATTQLLVAGLAAGQAKVAMGSARSGKAAALAWYPNGTGLGVAAVGGDGALRPNQPLTIAPPADRGSLTSPDCLGFVPGLQDLTLAYLDRVSSGRARWFSAEMTSSDGTNWGIPTTYDYQLAIGIDACPAFSGQPQGGGYAFAWQDQAGTWLGVGREAEVPDAASIGTVNTERVLSATQWGGASPAVVAIGVLPRDRYAVVFDTTQGYRLWPVDEREGVGPSQSLLTRQGRVGGLSYQPAGNDLWVTYADYTGTANNTGSRYLMRISCP